MAEPLRKLPEGEPYVAGADEFVIVEANSIEDVLAHLIGECGDDKQELINILETLP
jgi:hypothetical protein